MRVSGGMTYKVYNRRGSGGFVVVAALSLVGQPFELVEIESEPSTALPEEFRKTNPWRQVPVVITSDGTLMTESAAILIYLATKYPGKDIGPEVGTSGAASFLRWCVFLSVNVNEGVLRTVYPERFTTSDEGREAVREAALLRNSKAYELLENELKGQRFLLGDEMSLCDVYLAMLFSWHRDPLPYPNCMRVTHHVAAHPEIAAIWRWNFDHRTTMKWGR